MDVSRGKLQHAFQVAIELKSVLESIRLLFEENVPLIYLKVSVLTLAFNDVLQSKATHFQQSAYRENAPQQWWVLFITGGLKYGSSVRLLR